MSFWVRQSSLLPIKPSIAFGRACVAQVATVVALAGTVGAAIEPPAIATTVGGKVQRLVSVSCGHRVWSSAHFPVSIRCQGNGVEEATFAAVRRSIRRGYGRTNSLSWLPDVKERLELLEEHERRAAERRIVVPRYPSDDDLPFLPFTERQQEKER